MRRMRESDRDEDAGWIRKNYWDEVLEHHSTSKRLVETLTEMDISTFTELMYLN